MRHIRKIEQERRAMNTLVGLTGVFEGIASMRISQIKNQVLDSTKFFRELWAIYAQLRSVPQFGFGRSQSTAQLINKDLYVIITSEGTLSGDIDQKLVDFMASSYNNEKNDIIVIGHHGALQLAQLGIPYKRYFKLPIRDQNINVSPIIIEAQKYRSTTVFYQQYESLTKQGAHKIELSSAVQNEGNEAEGSVEAITESNYIFEPSTRAVVDHLEQSMMQITLSQLILESKLAQYASRFRAMSTAYERSVDQRDELIKEFYRARRVLRDKRLKETINSLRKTQHHVGLLT